MSLQYLLDGYNIIHQIPTSNLKPLEQQRNEFIRLIEIHRPQGSLKNNVTLVFDGKPGRSYPLESSVVKVLFSEQQSADDKIKAIVEGSDNRKNVIVVTNDRDVQYAVRASGAKVLSVEDFLKRCKKSSGSVGQKRKIDQNDKPKIIPKTVEYNITTELEQVWVKKGKRKKE